MFETCKQMGRLFRIISKKIAVDDFSEFLICGL